MCVIVLLPSTFNFCYRDRLRTTVNVFGDCVGVGIVARHSRKQLASLDESSTTSSGNENNRGTERKQSQTIFEESNTESSKL